MEIYVVERDIFEFESTEFYDPDRLTILGQAVNCRGVQGAGLALQMKKRYPQQMVEYKKLCNELPFQHQRKLLGTAQLIHVDHYFKLLNVFTQVDYGRNGVYTYNSGVTDAFNSLAEQIKNHAGDKPVDLCLPYLICCGLAGGDWSVVSKIIEDSLKDVSGRLIYFKKVF